jgi:20S proteasome alpha/beta subunit
MPTRTDSRKPARIGSCRYTNPARAGIIVAGWDPRNGGQVFSVPIGGSLHKNSYAIGGSGSTYIYGFCDAHWKEDMTESEAVAFCKAAALEAIKWDGSSGGSIRMVLVTKDGEKKHLYLPEDDYEKNVQRSPEEIAAAKVAESTEV